MRAWTHLPRFISAGKIVCRRRGVNHGDFSWVSAMFSRLCMPYDVERFRAGDRNLRFPPVNCNKIRFLWGKIAHGLAMLAEGNDAKSATKRLRGCSCFAGTSRRRFCFCHRRIWIERANGGFVASVSNCCKKRKIFWTKPKLFYILASAMEAFPIFISKKLCMVPSSRLLPTCRCWPSETVRKVPFRL